MKCVRKIRLELDEPTSLVLDGQSKIVNWLYNHLVEEANTLRKRYIESQDAEVGRQLYTKRGLRNRVPELKAQYPFLKSVYSSPLKNAALRLSRAIREYQKGRQGQRKKVSWPGFKKWRVHWFSLEYDEPWKGYSLEGTLLTLRLGQDQKGQRLSVEMKLTEPLPSGDAKRVKQLRIVKEHGVYFAIFTLERSQKVPHSSKAPHVIALDPNHKNLCYGVDTQGQAIEVQNLSLLKYLDQRIDEVKARRDRCQRKSRLVEYAREDGSIHRHWEPSRRWRFFDGLLQKLYRQRREQTKTYLFTLANQLCRDYDVIGIGNYTPHGGGINTGMRRAMNNQSLIGRFKDVLSWVCQKSGKRYLEYDERRSTRECHICRYVLPESLSPTIRQWQCPECAHRHIRDENAAQHGLERTFKQLKMPCSGHTPVKVRWTWEVKSSGVVRRHGDLTVQPVGLNTAKELNQAHGSA